MGGVRVLVDGDEGEVIRGWDGLASVMDDMERRVIPIPVLKETLPTGFRKPEVRHADARSMNDTHCTMQHS